MSAEHAAWGLASLGPEAAPATLQHVGGDAEGGALLATAVTEPVPEPFLRTESVTETVTLACERTMHARQVSPPETNACLGLTHSPAEILPA